MGVYLSERVRGLEPYTPGEQPQDRRYIKLNTNESPFGPSPKVKAVLEAEDADRLRLYPDPNGRELKQAIAKRNGLSEEEIFIGNGSDEVLALSILTFADQHKGLAFADPSYSFYPVWANLFGIPFKKIELRDNLYIDPADYHGLSETLLICNPNAPTSTAMSASQIESLMKEDPERLVIVDEAYVDFGAESVVPYIHAYPNLLVIQTFSKSRSLAGARLGFAMGQKVLIDAVKTVKNSFNSYTVNRLTLQMGQAAMEDEAYFEKTRQQIMETREKTKLALRELGFEVPDSGTNFLWAKHPLKSGSELYLKLKACGILVRHFSSPELNEYLRITIGSPEDMKELVRVIRELVGER